MAAAENPPLIDLGDDFDARPDAAARNPVDNRWRRAVQISVPLVAGLFVITGSVTPGATPLPLVAQVPMGLHASVLVTGDDAIVVDIEAGHNRVSEYALNGGHLVWSSEISLLASDVDVQVADGSVVISENDLQVSGVHTETFDVTTGRHLWDSTDGLRGVDAGGDLLMESPMTDSDPASELRRTNTRTGATVWSAPIALGCDTTFGYDDVDGISQGIVEICVPESTSTTSGIDQPTLRVLDFGTGVVRATRTLHLHSSEADFYLLPSERLPGPELNVFGDVVLVTHDNLPTATVDAFRVGDLAPLWAGLAITSATNLRQCGPELCVDLDGSSMTIDLHTGTIIGGTAPFGPLPAATGDIALPPGAGAPGGIALVPVGGAHLSVSAYPVTRVPEGIAVAVPLPTPGETWIVSVRDAPPPGESATHPIQPLHHIGPGSCWQAGAYLACSASAERLEFWRLPVGA